MLPELPRRLRTLLITLLLPTLLAGAVVATGTAPAAAAVRSLTAPTDLPRAIDPLAQYVGQDSCQPAFRYGTLRLGMLLKATYPNTTYAGSYACGTDSSRSEHYEGRALDWMNSIRNPTQAAQANAVLAFMLGTDKAGNKFAMARRMGIMYIIWNNRIWGAWDGKWEAYNNCAATPSTALDAACHRNHMHFSFSWNGALGRTSFWSKHVQAAVDYGPCRAKDMNWAADYAGYNPRPCPSYPAVAAPARSSAGMRALVAVSGAQVGYGMSGTPVRAIQQAFGIPITGRYDARLLSLMKWFQRSRTLPATGLVTVPTWRALLATYRPR